MRDSLMVTMTAVAVLAAAGPAHADEPQARTFTWTRGEAPKVIGNGTTDLCLLTQISGNFAGGGEQVRVYRQGDNWMLGGTSGQKQLKGGATCIAKTWFPRFATAPKYFVARSYDPDVATSCEQKRIPLPGSGRLRAYFISGVSGRFRGDGERVAVSDRKFGTTLQPSLWLNACSKHVGASVVSYELHSKKPIAYGNAKGESRPAPGEGFHVVTAGPSSKSAWEKFVKALPPYGIDTEGDLAPSSTRDMIPVDRGICGLTFISGKFQGYGEDLAIRAEKRPDGRMWWVLIGTILAEDNWVWGGARCLSRDQPAPLP